MTRGVKVGTDTVPCKANANHTPSRTELQSSFGTDTAVLHGSPRFLIVCSKLWESELRGNRSMKNPHRGFTAIPCGTPYRGTPCHPLFRMQKDHLESCSPYERFHPQRNVNKNSFSYTDRTNIRISYCDAYTVGHLKSLCLYAWHKAFSFLI